MSPSVPEMEGIYAAGGGGGGGRGAFLRIYLWWSLCALYLLARQVRVAMGNSGLCCVCVPSFER